MPFYFDQIRDQIRREAVLRWIGVIVVVVIVGGLIGYYGYRTWQENPETIRQLPAKIVEFLKVEEEALEEEGIGEEFALEEAPEIVFPAEKTYTETAETGDGITHLARKALKSYLSENPQDFEVTPEHKIYIEDYLVKQKGDHWLETGETMEFSEDSIQEALDTAETLSPEQLENLSQFSQLVPSLNY